MTAKRRTLKSMFVEPFYHIRFGLYVLVTGALFTAVFAALCYRAYSEQYQQVVQLFSVADSDSLLDNDIFFRNALILGGALGVFVTSLFFLVAKRTQKIAGPVRGMLRFTSELKAGNYSARLKVRDGDELTTLVRALNDLATNLHERFGVVNPEYKLAQDLDALNEQLRQLEEGLVYVEKPHDNPEQIKSKVAS